MTRVNITNEDGTHAGHFDDDKADTFGEDTEHDGRNTISVATGSQWDHEAVYRTSGGKWVLNAWSNRQGSLETYRFIDDDTARTWLLRNKHDESVARYFGAIPDEEDARPGRPEIGGKVTVNLGDLVADLDEYVKEEGVASRAEAIRVLLREALDAGKPYTVTLREISDGVRYVSSRHRTLGAAVEALREEQKDDMEDNGLPSYQPRVEHDGRPVDVEAYAD